VPEGWHKGSFTLRTCTKFSWLGNPVLRICAP